MAKRKNSITLGKALTTANDVEAQERVDAFVERKEHPLKYLTDAEIEAVSRRLNEVAYAMLSIHHLAGEGLEDKSGFYLVAIENLARGAFRGVDACIGKLTTGRDWSIGNFRDEIETTAATEETA